MKPSDPRATPIADLRVDRRAFVEKAATLALAPVLMAQSSGAARPDPAAADEGDESTGAFARVSELDEVTISALADSMASGRMTARAIVDIYLDAIARVDRSGPAINAVLEINPDAREIADALDAERREKGPRSVLHGIPILLKDSIGTKDKLHTSAGSLALAQSFAPADAYVVERLRAAGAIVLGKSNMSEWANARGSGSIGGWSGRGGFTRNPYALDRSSGGSSSGTAAAVAANLATAALGSDTIGSIISPASMCGIVGMRPTVGLVSRSGLIPLSITTDTIGPMARTVRDAALLLEMIAGADPRDPVTAEAGRAGSMKFSADLDPDALRGARIGVARNLFGTNITSDRVAERAIETIQSCGATIVEDANIETSDAIWVFAADVLLHELKAGLNQYLASLGPTAPVKDLAELIHYNVSHSDRELVWFGQETFEAAQSRGPLSSPQYRSALQAMQQLARDQGIDATLAKHKCDALVAPAQTPAWLIDVLLGDNTLLGSFLSSSAAGYPSISVPAGEVAGLPVGLLFMGPAWSDAKLLKYAFAFEQRARARRPPTFLPSISARP
jgi:amidase